MTSTIPIKLAYGDLESIYMPQPHIESIFGPFGADGVSMKDWRFHFNKESNTCEFEGDEHDWRITLLEISLSQKLVDISNDLSSQLEVIHSHVKHLRYTIDTLSDPQRSVSTNESK